MDFASRAIDRKGECQVVNVAFLWRGMSGLDFSIRSAQGLVQTLLASSVRAVLVIGPFVDLRQDRFLNGLAVSRRPRPVEIARCV